jgi:alpha-tubulin suppressor-like RCC1 family protein
LVIPDLAFSLGNGTSIGNTVPLAVNAGGTVPPTPVQYHAFVLCADGTLVSWGYNQRGQLGNSNRPMIAIRRCWEWMISNDP